MGVALTTERRVASPSSTIAVVAKHERQGTLPAWSGTTDMLVGMAERAQELTSDGVDRKTNVWVTVNSHQREDEYLKVENFREAIGTADLDRIVEMTISSGYQDPQQERRIYLRMGAGTVLGGAYLSVTGTNEFWVDGAFAAMDKLLDEGITRTEILLDWSRRLWWLLCIAASAAAVGAMLGDLRQDNDAIYRARDPRARPSAACLDCYSLERSS